MPPLIVTLYTLCQLNTRTCGVPLYCDKYRHLWQNEHTRDVCFYASETRKRFNVVFPALNKRTWPYVKSAPGQPAWNDVLITLLSRSECTSKCHKILALALLFYCYIYHRPGSNGQQRTYTSVCAVGYIYKTFFKPKEVNRNGWSHANEMLPLDYFCMKINAPLL